MFMEMQHVFNSDPYSAPVSSFDYRHDHLGALINRAQQYYFRWKMEIQDSGRAYYNPENFLTFIISSGHQDLTMNNYGFTNFITTWPNDFVINFPIYKVVSINFITNPNNGQISAMVSFERIDNKQEITISAEEKAKLIGDTRAKLYEELRREVMEEFKTQEAVDGGGE